MGRRVPPLDSLSLPYLPIDRLFPAYIALIHKIHEQGEKKRGGGTEPCAQLRKLILRWCIPPTGTR